MYIGSSKNIINRWYQHLSDLKDNKHHSYKLQNDYNNFGLCSFTFEVIELVNRESKLLDIEQRWVDFYKCYEVGYNVSVSSRKSIIYNNDTSKCKKNK